MKATIITDEIANERDVVRARRRARQIAELLDFRLQEQTHIATSVSEIARNALSYAGGGRIEYGVDSPQRSPRFTICISDDGPGIKDVEKRLAAPQTDAMQGIEGARRLMDHFQIESTPEGTTVTMGMPLPPGARRVGSDDVARIVGKMKRLTAENPLDELQQQNRELVGVLAELRSKQDELERTNRELEDTNRGVTALYAELEDKADQFKQASEVKGRFLSGMSHELRTPINSVLSLSQILLDRVDGELTGEQEKQVSFIRKGAQSLSELINDLLDMAKIEAGKFEANVTEFTAEDIFSGLRGMMKPLNRNPDVELIIEEARGIPPFRTDESKVSQIMRNLVSNALKYTTRGRVDVSVSADRDEETAVFSVVDTGVGIAPEDLERIFEEYTQTKATVGMRVQSTGLGLPLSRKMAGLLGGSLTVHSRPGEGSTFTAAIPLTYSPPDQPGGEPAAGEGGDVLIIDDEEASRYAMRRMLSDTNYRALEAADGPAGLDLARAEEPLAIILDLAIPGMDGFTVLDELKTDPATRAIPVIICTSKNLSDDDRERLAPGAEAILSKQDLSREVLLRQIGSVLVGNASGTVE
ncbi:MAG: ATP-binding protein [Phycisphaerae bacterium]|jgi:signal transduction histidine kinase/CheY-like chemotaxis protein|nr:ATP-binding protein [Phycisphaerae bacterium]